MGWFLSLWKMTTIVHLFAIGFWWRLSDRLIFDYFLSNKILSPLSLYCSVLFSFPPILICLMSHQLSPHQCCISYGCNVALLGSTKRLNSLVAFVNLVIWVAQNALAIGKIFCIKLPTNLLIFWSILFFLRLSFQVLGILIFASSCPSIYLSRHVPRYIL